MARVIAIANQKGGVGKTATVANLGAALAERGKDVVLVDLDPQAALTAGFGLDPYKITRTTYTLLTRDHIPFAGTLRPVADRIHVCPASVDLAAAEIQLANYPDRAYRLRDALERNRMPFDFILIDTPPSVGVLTVNALSAADELIVPVQCQYLPMRGVRALLETVWLVHERMNPKLDLLGVLPTMYRRASKHSREVVQELREVFADRVFDLTIVEDDAVAEAPVAKKSVLAYATGSEAAAGYRRLAEVICNGR
ncbi:MAG: AAA family ATPase [Chloroflexi bacterium]|nr:AAA family ATPase [Chloroflexota bacterium]